MFNVYRLLTWVMGAEYSSIIIANLCQQNKYTNKPEKIQYLPEQLSRTSIPDHLWLPGHPSLSLFAPYLLPSPWFLFYRSNILSQEDRMIFWKKWSRYEIGLWFWLGSWWFTGCIIHIIHKNANLFLFISFCTRWSRSLNTILPEILTMIII